jgi:hypothetical protein
LVVTDAGSIAESWRKSTLAGMALRADEIAKLRALWSGTWPTVLPPFDRVVVDGSGPPRPPDRPAAPRTPQPEPPAAWRESREVRAAVDWLRTISRTPGDRVPLVLAEEPRGDIPDWYRPVVAPKSLEDLAGRLSPR